MFNFKCDPWDKVTLLFSWDKVFTFFCVMIINLSIPHQCPLWNCKVGVSLFPARGLQPIGRNFHLRDHESNQLIPTLAPLLGANNWGDASHKVIWTFLLANEVRFRPIILRFFTTWHMYKTQVPSKGAMQTNS